MIELLPLLILVALVIGFGLLPSVGQIFIGLAVIVTLAIIGWMLELALLWQIYLRCFSL